MGNEVMDDSHHHKPKGKRIQKKQPFPPTTRLSVRHLDAIIPITALGGRNDQEALCPRR